MDSWTREADARSALIRRMTRWPADRCDEIAYRLVGAARELHVRRGLAASHPCAREPREAP